MSELRLQQAGAKFGLLCGLCYESSTDFWSTPTEISGSRVQARTNGSQLLRYNVEHFEANDVETEFAVLLHEVTHHEVTKPGRGNSSHGPDFWEAFQRNFNSIQESDQARALVESAFSSYHFDRERARHRAVQSVSQVDKRSETTDERREKLANAIGFDAYDVWKDVTRHRGPQDRKLRLGADTCVHARIGTGTARYASELDDEELFAFLHKHELACPLPVVSLNIDTYHDDEPQVIHDPDNWKPWRNSPDSEAWKAIAVQERMNGGYVGVSKQMLQQEADIDRWEDVVAMGDILYQQLTSD